MAGSNKKQKSAGGKLDSKTVVPPPSVPELKKQTKPAKTKEASGN
jgi:hypothetical protein